MLPRLLAAAVLALGALGAQAQYADPNLQNLLSALMNGGEATLLTPTTNGMLQVSSFRSPVRMNAVDAAAYFDRARDQLSMLGVTTPSAEQVARALAGGPIDVPTGRFTMPGLLPQNGIAATLVSQLVVSGTPVAGYGSAAAGGSAPGAAPAAREAAIRTLASIGIINPSEEQIRLALVGGTITTVNGVYQLPGILPR
jgi:hypothetical protein